MGYFWFLGALSESNNDWLFTPGNPLGSLAFGAFVHLLLAFPGGRLTAAAISGSSSSRTPSSFAGALAAPAAPGVSQPDLSTTCRSTIASDTTTASTSSTHRRALLPSRSSRDVLVIVVTRFLRARGALRRALGPVLGAGALVMLVLALQMAVDSYSAGAAEPLEYVFLAAFATVPLAFLIGVLRSRLARVRRRRPPARARPGDTDPRRARGRSRRPDARDRLLAAGTGTVCLRRGKPLPDKPDGRAIDARRARRTADGRAPARSAARRRARARRRGRRGRRALARQRASPGEAPRGDRVPRGDRQCLPVAALLAQPRRQIANLNDAAWNASGYVLENDVKGQLFWDVFVGPEARAEARRRFEEAAPAHEAASFEHTFVNQLGERLTIAWSTAPLYEEDGSLRYVVCGGLDITERERQHQQLQASEERLRAAIDASPVAIVEYALDDTITRWNPAAERIFGWTAEQVVGGKAKHQPPGREAELAELFRRVRDGEVYTGVESTRVRSDGSTVDVAIAAAPIRDPAGNVVSHMALFADISERKRQEKELRASRARIVEAGDEARRQLERNLHDGAQQRLVALSLSLRLAQSKVSTDPDAADAVLEGARAELAAALDDLRELARGIHPAVLTDRGLAAAVEALAARSPVPVEFETPDEELPAPVEAAAYYVIAEALANVIKYARATGVTVRVAREDGRAVVRSPTTASAAPIRPSARACAVSPTASRRSAAASRSRARPAAARA